jgi:hypothetical protein
MRKSLVFGTSGEPINYRSEEEHEYNDNDDTGDGYHPDASHGIIWSSET